MSERTFEVQYCEVKSKEKYLYLQQQHWHCITAPMAQQQKANSIYQALLSNFKGTPTGFALLKTSTKPNLHIITSYNYRNIAVHQEQLQYSKMCILLPKLHVKLKQLCTNPPVLEHLYWSKVNIPTFNASHWILEWAIVSSFPFSSQKVLTKSLYCCFHWSNLGNWNGNQPLEQTQPQHTAEKPYLDILVSPRITCTLAKLVEQTDQT